MEEEELKAEAKELGKRVAEPVPESVIQDDVDDVHTYVGESYSQTAEYANHILPHLRKLAGYGDNGKGTYTIEEEGDKFLYDELVDQFWIGFHEAIDEAMVT